MSDRGTVAAFLFLVYGLVPNCGAGAEATPPRTWHVAREPLKGLPPQDQVRTVREAAPASRRGLRVDDQADLDFRVLLDSPVLKPRRYPEGTVPGVTLGTLSP